MERRIEELSRRGGGGSKRLDRVRLTATASTIEFADIPQYGYQNLQLVISAGGTHTALVGLKCRVNGMAAGYDMQFIEGQGTGSVAGRINNTNAMEVGVVGPVSGDGMSTTSEALFADYTDPQMHMATARSAYVAGPAAVRQWSAAGLYWGTPRTPITRLTLYPATGQFVAGSTFTLYGLT